MPKFAANLSYLFQDRSLPDRVFAAADAGFEGVEILFPYDTPVPALARALRASGLPLLLINAPPPNYTGGARGFAAVPGSEDRFRSDFRRVLRYAEALGTRMVHVMSGAAEGPEARQVLAGNLAWAAEAAARSSDLVLTLEPISPEELPGYFLNDFDLAAGLVAEIGAPNLRLQFDAFHAHALTGNVLAAWQAYRDITVHVQAASHPGRHEPERGAIDYPAFFDRLDADGYAGFVSGEYHPAGDTATGLGWMARAS